MRNVIRFFQVLSVLGCAFAEEIAGPHVLDPYVVTAPPVLEYVSVRADASLVNTVGEEQIRALGASDLAGALRRVPGVTVSRFNSVGAYGGGDGGAIFIRGHGSGRPGAEIATLVDGVPRFNGIWTHPLLDMVSIDNARRIDVFKSPQPVLFGNMAFGAVNLVPKEAEGPGETRIHASGGKHDTRTVLGEHGWSGPDWRTWVTGSHRRSDGHRPDAAGEVNNTYAHIGRRIGSAWDLSLLVNHQTGRAEDPRAEDEPDIPFVERYKTGSTFLLAKLAHTHATGNGALRAYYESGETVWRLYDDTAPPPPVDEAFTNFSDFENYGLKLFETVELDAGPELTLGYDFQSYGGEVGDIYDDTPAANDRQPERRLEHHAVYAQALWPFDAAGGVWTPSAGLRFNESRQFEDQYGAQLGLTYEVGDTRVYANFARAFNYAGLYTAIFNDRWLGLAPGEWKDLDAETVLHYEIGIERRWNDRLRTTVSAYYDDVRDALRFDSPPPPVSLANSDSYRASGVELFAFVTPADALDLFVGGAWQDAHPGDVPNYPEWSLSAGLHWRFRDRWTLHADAEYVSEQFTQGTRFDDGPEGVGARFLLNTRLARAFELFNGGLHGEVFCMIENLTDRDYEYRPGYPMPGVSPSIGIDLEF